MTAHEFLHLKQPLFLIDDLVALFVFFDDPIDQFIDFGVIRGRQKRAVFVEVFEMRRIDDGRFDDVIIDPNVVFLRKFGERLHIIHVRTANAHVEEHRDAVLPHVLDEIFEVGPNWS